MSDKRSGKSEKIFTKLRKYCSEAKVKVILYGVGVNKNITWESINNSYLKGIYDSFEDAHLAYQDDPTYIKAYKLALEHVHNIRLIELYDLYYSKAKEDVQSFKAFLDFSEKFFKDGNEENELMTILKGVDLDE